MTNEVNINLNQLVGLQPKGRGFASSAKGVSNADLSSFIDALASMLQPNSTTNINSLLAQGNSEENKFALAVNLASQLKEQGLLPESLANISLGELSQAILTSLEGSDIASNTLINKDALIKSLSSIKEPKRELGIRASISPDLATILNIENPLEENNIVQPITTAEEDLATLLLTNANAINLEDINNSDDKSIADLLLTMTKQQEELAQELNALDPKVQADLLNYIKSRLANTDTITKQDLETVKDNVISSLKALGLSDKDIKTQLTALAKELNGTESKEIIDFSAKKISNRADLTTELTVSNSMIKSASNNNQNISAKISGMGVSAEAIQSASQNSFNTDNSDFMHRHEKPLYDLDSLNSNSQSLDKSLSATSSFSNYLSAAKGNAPTTTTQMIAVQLHQNINAKVNSMKIQLMPENLGKLDINLRFGKDGSIKAHLIAEKPETLSMLKRDSFQLEKILQEAGFDTTQDSLSFDLQQSNQEHLGAFRDNNKNAYGENFAASLDNQLSLDNMLQAQIAIEAAGYITSHGVNIQV